MLFNIERVSVLVVEDDKFKLDSIRRFLKEIFVAGVEVFVSQSLAGASRLIEHELFDLVVIDMSIHSHDPEQGAGSPVPLSSGGLDVLFEVMGNQPDARCVILTQYTDIPIEGEPVPVQSAAAQILLKFGICVAGCIQYSESDSSWKSQFKAALEGM